MKGRPKGGIGQGKVGCIRGSRVVGGGQLDYCATGLSDRCELDVDWMVWSSPKSLVLWRPIGRSWHSSLVRRS